MMVCGVVHSSHHTRASSWGFNLRIQRYQPKRKKMVVEEKADEEKADEEKNNKVVEVKEEGKLTKEEDQDWKKLFPNG